MRKPIVSVQVKEHELVDRALKRFKREAERAGVIKEIRSRVAYVKPSVKRRMTRLYAIYKQKLYDAEER